jgi:hypothetical protein
MIEDVTRGVSPGNGDGNREWTRMDANGERACGVFLGRWFGFDRPGWGR